MVSTYTTNLRLDLQGTGDNNGTWGTVANTDFSLIDDSIAGYVKVSVSGGDTTLSTNNGSSDNARKAMIEIVGSPTSAANVVIPANSKQYIVRCSLSNSTAAIVKISGTTGFTLTNGINQYVITDGTTVTGESAQTSSGVVAGSYNLPFFSVNGFGAVTSASSLTSVGLVTQTSAGPLVRRVSAGTGIAITNPDGTAGDILVALSATGVTSATYGNARTLNINPYGQVVSVVSATAPREYNVFTTVITGYTVVSVGVTVGTSNPSSNGQLISSIAIVPQSTQSTIVVEAYPYLGCTNGGYMMSLICKNSASTPNAVGSSWIGTNNIPVQIPVFFKETPGVTTTVTYDLRVGIQPSFGAGGLNGGLNSGQAIGGMGTLFRITEIL